MRGTTAIASTTFFALAALLGMAAGQGRASAQAANSSADNEWLKTTRDLYYSSEKAGLKGFDCDVHPDWKTLLVSAGKGAAVADDDPRIVLLKPVKVTLHVQMSQGPSSQGSTVDWNANAAPGTTPDQQSAAMLEGMHRSVEQTLDGFLQFWTPFIENKEVPEAPNGLEITHTATTHTIHAKQGSTEMTEVFDKDRVLEEFDVNLNGISVKFAPSFEPTPKGLRVYKFDAHLTREGGEAGQRQDMHVSIQYQTVNNVYLPSTLNMDVVGTGTFSYTFDGSSTTGS